VIKKNVLALSIFLLPFSVHANVDIATCSELVGSGFYHGAGLVNKENQGWKKDAITGGYTTFKKLKDGKYDILILDATKTVYSLRQDGGEVMLIRRGKKDATFLHIHPGMVIELYTLWEDPDGKYRFDLLSSKGGDGMRIHKSSVMTGKCERIDFSKLD
jgi:hypothetical protein